MSSRELVGPSSQYVGPYRLEKTLGKGQTGKSPVRNGSVSVTEL